MSLYQLPPRNIAIKVCGIFSLQMQTFGAAYESEMLTSNSWSVSVGIVNLASWETGLESFPFTAMSTWYPVVPLN